jgi:peroxiredoxin
MRTLLLVVALSAAVAAPPQFDLRDTAGVRHTAEAWRGKKAVVVFFVMTDCPLSNGYVPEMNRIRADYASQGIAFYAAHSDPFVTEEAVRAHVAEFGYRFPVLLDTKLVLAKAAGATVVPEVAVFSGAGELLYLGRIDNRMEDITRRRTHITEHELREALDAILAGRAPKVTRRRAVGCSINFEGVK